MNTGTFIQKHPHLLGSFIAYLDEAEHRNTFPLKRQNSRM